MTRVSGDLAITEQHLAQALRWPKNLGIEFRRLHLSTTPPAEVLLVSVHGLISAQAMADHVLGPLASYQGPPGQADLSRIITVHGQQTTDDCDRVIEAVLDGYAALLADGWRHALLLDLAADVQHHALHMGRDPNDEVFARDVRINIALLRKRLRDPRLLAFRVDLARPQASEVAMLYLEGRASPSVVRAVRRWAHKHVGEETASLGLIQPARAALGLLPRFSSIRWVNKAAVLLDNGYVVLIVDGVKHVFAAPVTHASWMSSPSDYDTPYPVKRWLARTRITGEFIAVMLPATVVALLNYHQEMVPVGFLLAVASARENAPFGVFFETLGAELLVEAGREASFRLPVALPIGSALISTVLILVIAVQTGFIGPVPALATALGSMLSLTLPTYGGAYVVRLWRLIMMVGAVILGFFGIATVLFVLLTYLLQARSWGVPFVGPSGWEMIANQRASSRRPRGMGGN